MQGKELSMFLRVGHRGARAYEIENTLQSFKKALELGVNAVELDVRQSKDRKLILSHDENLKRLFGMDVPVSRATLKELKQLTNNKIITLAEALVFLDSKVEKILVELKESGYEKKVLDVIMRERLLNRAIVVSFHEDTLAAVRSLHNKIETGLIYARFRNPVDVAKRIGAGYLLPLYRFVHTKNVGRAHENNLKVVVWTINTQEEAREYIAKGVDGIASDKPDIFEGMEQG